MLLVLTKRLVELSGRPRGHARLRVWSIVVQGRATLMAMAWWFSRYPLVPSHFPVFKSSDLRVHIHVVCQNLSGHGFWEGIWLLLLSAMYYTPSKSLIASHTLSIKCLTAFLSLLIYTKSISTIIFECLFKVAICTLWFCIFLHQVEQETKEERRARRAARKAAKEAALSRRAAREAVAGVDDTSCISNGSEGLAGDGWRNLPGQTIAKQPEPSKSSHLWATSLTWTFQVFLVAGNWVPQSYGTVKVQVPVQGAEQELYESLHLCEKL